LRAFQRVLVEEGCDAVMVQDYEHPRFDALVLLARRMGLGAYATFQGGDVNGSVLERAVRGFSLRACRAVIVPSARERRRLAAAYAIPPQRIFDVPNPVDTQEWSSEGRAKARAKLGIDPETFLVVNHGRIDIHRKGLDVALKAWARVAAEMPRARLTLIGSGQDDAAFERLVDATPACDWLRGYVTAPSMIREWLSAADVYLTLSRVEGMPVAPLEAMACGLPVVSSDAHGLADIFSGGEECGGLLVGRERHEEAAEALRRLGGDPSLRLRLGTRAREAVEQRYSSPAVGLALREVLSASHP
jgi:starch synthase